MDLNFGWYQRLFSCWYEKYFVFTWNEQSKGLISALHIHCWPKCDSLYIHAKSTNFSTKKMKSLFFAMKSPLFSLNKVRRFESISVVMTARKLWIASLLKLVFSIYGIWRLSFWNLWWWWGYGRFAKTWPLALLLKFHGVISQWLALILAWKIKEILGDKDVGYLHSSIEGLI